MGLPFCPKTGYGYTGFVSVNTNGVCKCVHERVGLEKKCAVRRCTAGHVRAVYVGGRLLAIEWLVEKGSEWLAAAWVRR